MTYHDALISQLTALISIVSSLRERIKDVSMGVVQALRVPQRAIRCTNILWAFHKLHNWLWGKRGRLFDYYFSAPK